MGFSSWFQGFTQRKGRGTTRWISGLGTHRCFSLWCLRLFLFFDYQILSSFCFQVRGSTSFTNYLLKSVMLPMFQRILLCVKKQIPLVGAEWNSSICFIWVTEVSDINPSEHNPLIYPGSLQQTRWPASLTQIDRAALQNIKQVCPEGFKHVRWRVFTLCFCCVIINTSVQTHGRVFRGISKKLPSYFSRNLLIIIGMFPMSDAVWNQIQEKWRKQY